MIPKLKFLIIGLIAFSCLNGQQFVEIQINQVPPLEVSILEDLEYSGEPVRLGEDKIASGGTGDYIFLWSPSENLDNPGIAQPLANPSENTTYTLMVTDASGCSELVTQKVNVDNTTIEYRRNIPHVKIYPIPSDELINLSISYIKVLDYISFAVYNTSGQIVFKQKSKVGSNHCFKIFDFKELRAGSYILVITSPEFTTKHSLLIY